MIAFLERGGKEREPEVRWMLSSGLSSTSFPMANAWIGEEWNRTCHEAWVHSTRLDRVQGLGRGNDWVQFVGSCGWLALNVVHLSDPVEALTDRCGVFAGDARLAKMVCRKIDGASDRFDGQIPERIAFELRGHVALDFVGQHAVIEELGGVQFVDGGHIDAVKARRDDGWASDANVNLLGTP